MMKTVCILGLLLLVCVSWSAAKDLIVGTSYNTHLEWLQKAEYLAIPFMKREKEVFYSDPSQKIIKGIIARDLDHTEGSATITAGGLGFSFVNVRIKSARGSRINYQVEIYV